MWNVKTLKTKENSVSPQKGITYKSARIKECQMSVDTGRQYNIPKIEKENIIEPIICYIP